MWVDECPKINKLISCVMWLFKYKTKLLTTQKDHNLSSLVASWSHLNFESFSLEALSPEQSWRNSNWNVMSPWTKKPNIWRNLSVSISNHFSHWNSSSFNLFQQQVKGAEEPIQFTVTCCCGHAGCCSLSVVCGNQFRSEGKILLSTSSFIGMEDDVRSMNWLI